MSTILPHLPALRRGKPYASLEQADVKDCRTGGPLARISQVNAGIIRKDFARITEAHAARKKFSCEYLMAIWNQAADLFLTPTPPLGHQAHAQHPSD